MFTSCCGWRAYLLNSEVNMTEVEIQATEFFAKATDSILTDPISSTSKILLLYLDKEYIKQKKGDGVISTSFEEMKIGTGIQTNHTIIECVKELERAACFDCHRLIEASEIRAAVLKQIEYSLAEEKSESEPPVAESCPHCGSKNLRSPWIERMQKRGPGNKKQYRLLYIRSLI